MMFPLLVLYSFDVVFIGWATLQILELSCNQGNQPRRQNNNTFWQNSHEYDFPSYEW